MDTSMTNVGVAEQREKISIDLFSLKSVPIKSTSDLSTIVLNANQKILFLIRHAQGTHNLAVLEKGGIDGGPEEEYRNPKWFDAELTETGVNQAKNLQGTINPVDIDVIFSSPLSRAIQTAMNACPNNTIVVTELIRERIGTHPCDKRRTQKELMEKFPNLDTRLLDTDEDPYWTEEREPFDDLINRSTEFLQFLFLRAECRIAAFTHNDFLKALLLHNEYILAEDEGVHRVFGNADILALIVTKN